jgi:hypothetical protein
VQNQKCATSRDYIAASAWTKRNFSLDGSVSRVWCPAFRLLRSRLTYLRRTYRMKIVGAGSVERSEGWMPKAT